MYYGNIYFESFLAKYDKKKAAEKLNIENKNSSNDKKRGFKFFFKSETKAF